MSYRFNEKTWPEIQEYVKKNALVILPIGELEEHSLYLPIDTDARIAKYLGDQIAEEIQDEIPVLVLPTVWSGYTPKKVGQWPGAMRLNPKVFLDMIHDICASIADMGFKKMFMLDCHGQHAPMINIVSKNIADEYGYYYSSASPVVFCSEEFNAVRKSPKGGCSHAGEWESSLLLHISPELVKTDKFTNIDSLKHATKFVAGDTLYGGQKVTWSSFGIEPTKYGGLGDPTAATAKTGKIIVEAVRKNAKEFLMDYYFYEPSKD